MADGIWVIEETSFEAVEWGRTTHSAVDTDLGYFATFREAQKACNRLNAAQMLRYDEAVNRVLQRNAGVALRNDKRLEDWKAEVAAGRVLSPPCLERLDRVPTFDGWCYENILRYEPVEVAPAVAEEGTQEAGGCPHAAWQDLGHARTCEDCGERLDELSGLETRKAAGISRLSEAVDAC